MSHWIRPQNQRNENESGSPKIQAVTGKPKQLKQKDGLKIARSIYK